MLVFGSMFLSLVAAGIISIVLPLYLNDLGIAFVGMGFIFSLGPDYWYDDGVYRIRSSSSDVRVQARFRHSWSTLSNLRCNILVRNSWLQVKKSRRGLPVHRPPNYTSMRSHGNTRFTGGFVIRDSS